MTKTEPNAGFAAGIGEQSEARKLSYRLKAAPLRTKDLRLNSVTAVAEGRKLRDHVTALMQTAEALPENAVVYCVFAERDLSRIKGAKPLGVKNDGAADLAIAAEFLDALPIGFLVFVIDMAEKERPVFGHARPLIVEDPRGLALNKLALSRFMKILSAGLSKGN